MVCIVAFFIFIRKRPGRRSGPAAAAAAVVEGYNKDQQFGGLDNDCSPTEESQTAGDNVETGREVVVEKSLLPFSFSSTWLPLRRIVEEVNSVDRDRETPSGSRIVSLEKDLVERNSAFPLHCDVEVPASAQQVDMSTLTEGASDCW